MGHELLILHLVRVVGVGAESGGPAGAELCEEAAGGSAEAAGAPGGGEEGDGGTTGAGGEEERGAGEQRWGNVGWSRGRVLIREIEQRTPLSLNHWLTERKTL